mmetsp:Transcript_86256/g.209086  ORF Transcript_86256/g.209086 Transcript_86256/m.209086 type:complete len:252 (+) Transcript_86256:194-949(+)
MKTSIGFLTRSNQVLPLLTIRARAAHRCSGTNRRPTSPSPSLGTGPTAFRSGSGSSCSASSFAAYLCFCTCWAVVEERRRRLWRKGDMVQGGANDSDELHASRLRKKRTSPSLTRMKARRILTKTPCRVVRGGFPYDLQAPVTRKRRKRKRTSPRTTSPRTTRMKTRTMVTRAPFVIVRCRFPGCRETSRSSWVVPRVRWTCSTSSTSTMMGSFRSLSSLEPWVCRIPSPAFQARCSPPRQGDLRSYCRLH